MSTKQLQLDAQDMSHAWYWTKGWQQAEKEVEEHIRKDEVESFDTMDEFLASLGP